MANSTIKRNAIYSDEIISATNTTTSVTVPGDKYSGFIFTACNNNGKSINGSHIVMTSQIKNSQITRFNLYAANAEVDYSMGFSNGEITISMLAASSNTYGAVYGIRL